MNDLFSIISNSVFLVVILTLGLVGLLATIIVIKYGQSRAVSFFASLLFFTAFVFITLSAFLTLQAL